MTAANIFKNELRKFNVDKIKHLVFYNFPVGIRFEIGIGEVYNSMGKQSGKYVSQALNRVNSIFESAFPDGADLLIFEFNAQAEGDQNLIIKRFSEGITSIPPHEIISENIEDDNLCIRMYWDLSKCSLNLQNLFKEIILADIGGKFPGLTSAIYLFDTNRHIIFHLYDDRGLDVAAIDRETLLLLYQKYNSWILDYDRPKIEKLFEGYSP